MFELNLSETNYCHQWRNTPLDIQSVHGCSTNSAILANEIAFIEFFTFLIVNQKDHISL